MLSDGQVNNAGITGTIVTDPDVFRSAIAADQVSSHVQFPSFLKCSECGWNFKKEICNLLGGGKA